MRSQDVVRIARERAGLTQHQLAARSGRPRETIARWETGAQEPSLEALQAIVDACQLELVLHLAERDTSLGERVREQLPLPPLQRLARLLPTEAFEDAVAGLQWLAHATTATVVIGSLAAALQGAPQRPESGAVEFVSADPVAMEAEMRTAGLVPLDVDERWLDVDARAPWRVGVDGVIVMATNVRGTRDYPDLRRSAVPVGLDGSALRAAHPRDLLRIADASRRDADRARVPGLRALLSETS